MKAAYVRDSGAHCSKMSKMSSSWLVRESVERELPDDRIEFILWADLTLPDGSSREPRPLLSLCMERRAGLGDSEGPHMVK